MLSFDMTSEDGERTCPLCAEEMDLTDQQLKPCKCGYEICVWCWHHIIDMAEKDETEGRCPACRTPYDKERIVGMAANCERVVVETNSEKKRSHKAKPKTSAEAKKHLSSVRVIQRNLVYIIGLPSNLCDEAVLERKEYFGQYGKVLKVSISRPASAPSQQQLNNNTFSVYITYAREEEAVRCIQSVHNFILEGKPLRACFGTTKYCHAWLRNMTCSNPDCLYLHDVGIQEDSFTKDEIISAYTRSRVPQIASSSSQRRSGYILPPPVDDLLCPGNKILVKSTANGVPNSIKGSPISNAGKSTGLPAAASWGLRAANFRPLAAGTPCSQLNKQKVDSVNNSTMLSSLTESTKQPSAWHDEVVPTSKIPEGKTSTTNMSSSSLAVDSSKQMSAWNDEIALTSKGSESRETLQTEYTSHSSESIKLGASKECSLTVLSSTDIDSDPALRYSAWDDDSVTRSESGEERKSLTLVEEPRQLDGRRPFTEKKSQISASDLSSMGVSDAKCTSGLPSSSSLTSLLASAHKDKERSTPVYDICTNSVNNPSTNDLDQPSRVGPENILQGSNSMEDVANSLCLNLSTASIDDSYNADQNGVNHHALGFSTCSAELSETWDSSLPSGCMMDDPLLRDPNDSSEFPNSRLKSLKKDITSEINRMEDPVITSVGQGITHLDIIDQPSSSSFPSNSHIGISNLNSTTINSLGNKKLSGIDVNGVIEPSLFLRDKEPAVANGYKQNAVSSFSMPRKVFEFPESNCTEENMGSLERGVNDAGNHSTTATVDTTGESNIISDILSLDFNPWDDSLFSSDNIAMLLGETERNEHSFKSSNSLRSQNSNQSRFSFARQEATANITESLLRDKSHPQNLSSLQDVYGAGSQNRLLFDGLEGPNYAAITAPVVSSDKFSGILKPKVSAPPGFSIPNRAPPPGFSSQDRFNRTYEPEFSENHLVAGSIGNSYQAQLTVNSGDVEFIDPAIMAVVKERLPVGICNSGMGLKPTFSTHLSTSDSDPRFQLLMQQSGQPHSNFRVSHQMGDRFLPLNDTYITSQFLSQNQSNLSPFAQMTLSQPRNSHYTNSHWSGWNDIRMGNDMSTNDILRNERLGINNYYSGSEEPKFHLPGSDVYNRAFGL